MNILLAPFHSPSMGDQGLVTALSWRRASCGCHCPAPVSFESFTWRAAVATAARCASRPSCRIPWRPKTCNCSMCEKVGFIHVIVPESRFRITAGEDRLTRYTFNTGVAQHLFCSPAA